MAFQDRRNRALFVRRPELSRVLLHHRILLTQRTDRQFVELAANTAAVGVAETGPLNHQHEDHLPPRIDPALRAESSAVAERAGRKRRAHPLRLADDAPPQPPAVAGRETGSQIAGLARLASGRRSNATGRAFHPQSHNRRFQIHIMSIIPLRQASWRNLRLLVLDGLAVRIASPSSTRRRVRNEYEMNATRTSSGTLSSAGGIRAPGSARINGWR